jgi:DNA-binding GntR family transcriptional regulator
MYNMFELKYQSLQDSILSVFDRIKKDELLSTMLNDRTSSIHLEDRVREIFGEVVAEERELIFKKLGTQIANLKFENEELSRQLKRLKESNSNMEKEFCTERLTFEQIKNNTD